MFILDEFRAGQYGVPFSDGDEMPRFCDRCVYLMYQESDGCFCGSPFYYYCAYSWPDKLTHTVPPCLEE